MVNDLISEYLAQEDHALSSLLRATSNYAASVGTTDEFNYRSAVALRARSFGIDPAAFLD